MALKLPSTAAAETVAAAAAAETPAQRWWKHGKPKARRGIGNGGEGDLTEFDQFAIKTHALAKKHGLLSNPTEEAMESFAQEQKKLVESTEEQMACTAYEESRSLVTEEVVSDTIAEERPVEASEEESAPHESQPDNGGL